MFGIARVVAGTTGADVRAALVCLMIALLFIPVSAAAAEDQQPPKTMPIQATVSVNWDIDEGGTRNQGSMTMRMQGTAHLAEGVSVMDPAAPPGTIITYAAKGVKVNYTYKETVTQNTPPRGCPALMAEYDGHGVFTLEEFNSAMTSGLNIRKMGSLIPREMLKFAPPEAQEFMIDYYDFFAVAKKQQVQGRKRGWNDCNFVEDTREFNPTGLTIRFRITDDGKMTGSRRWSADGNSGAPSFNIRVSDLPEKFERRPLVPEPGGDGAVTYAVNWTFGEVDPYVQIQRREGGEWISITEEPVKVKVGEKLELRGMVMPEEKDTGKGKWTVPGKTVQDFVVQGDRGFVDWLEDTELDTQEVQFHWWDGEDGLEVSYDTTSTNGKKLTGTAAFDVAEPETVLRAYVEDGKFGIAEVRYTDEDGSVHERTELLLVNGVGKTITFCHDPLPGEFQPGRTQFVQRVRTIGRVTKHKEALAGPCMQIDVEGLDGHYPYAPGPKAQDSPGTPVSLYDLTIAVQDIFTMQLMYKPDTEGAIFVPLSDVDWTWTVNCGRGSITEDWVLGDCGVSAPPTGSPAEAWMEWDRVSTGDEVWDACE